MRRGWGRGGSIVWGLAVWAACGRAVHPSPEPRIEEATCILAEPPSIAPDTAAIAFRALDGDSRACAQMLVAQQLRTWRSASARPWTVGIVLTPTGATARRLDARLARNLVDGGQPLLVTEDIELVAYAAARPDLEVVPLPWDRTYAFLAPTVDSALGAVAGPEAVRVDARAAEPLACDSAPRVMSSEAAPRQWGRVAYDASDPTARELAERIVALTPGSDVAAVGMSTVELDAAIAVHHELAYVISMPRVSRCDALASLAARASWVGAQSVVPLIETRTHGIAPRSSRP